MNNKGFKPKFKLKFWIQLLKNSVVDFQEGSSFDGIVKSIAVNE